MDAETTLTDRIAGSLYGLLVGDAFGCPVECLSPGAIRARYGELTEMVATDADRRARPRGLHSDDGQQAMALCDALLLEPEAPAPHFARTLVALLRTGQRGAGLFGAHRGTGRNFRATVKALAGGAGVHEAAQPSAGNGVAMLTAPLGWYFRDDDAALRAAVLDVGRVKQRDVRGLAAGGAVAFLVARGLSVAAPAELDRAALVDFARAVERDAAAALAAPPDARFSDALADALAHERDAPAELLARIAANATASSERACAPGSGYALASVVTAIWAALRAPSFERAVVSVVALGDDADTTGAITGAIAGAVFGRGAIPARWYDALVARDRFDDRLAPLAARARGFRPAVSLVTLERDWSAPLAARA